MKWGSGEALYPFLMAYSVTLCPVCLCLTAWHIRTGVCEHLGVHEPGYVRALVCEDLGI